MPRTEWDLRGPLGVASAPWPGEFCEVNFPGGVSAYDYQEDLEKILERVGLPSGSYTLRPYPGGGPLQWVPVCAVCGNAGGATGCGEDHGYDPSSPCHYPA